MNITFILFSGKIPLCDYLENSERVFYRWQSLQYPVRDNTGTFSHSISHTRPAILWLKKLPYTILPFICGCALDRYTRAVTASKGLDITPFYIDEDEPGQKATG